jgi:MFS family permease
MTPEENIAKLLLVIEAFLGGFYVSITRGLFIPMITYSGYTIDNMALILFPTGLSGSLLSLLIYRYSEGLTRRFRILTLSTHVFERVAWFLLPLMLGNVALISLTYTLGNLVSALVSILMGALIYSYFSSLEDVIKVAVWRSAAGAVASLLGSLFMTFVSYAYNPPESYLISYFVAFVIGFGSSIALILVPRFPSQVMERRQEPPLEVMIRGHLAFLVLTFMLAGSNLVGLSWTPFLRNLGAPIYITLALSITGNLGGTVGSFLFKDYKSYMAGLLTNTMLTALIPFINYPYIHVGLSFLTSLTFTAANLLAMQIFAEVNSRMGRLKASAFMVAGNYAGLLIASLVALILVKSPPTGLALSAVLKLLAAILVLIAIPETAIIPERKAYEFSKLIYSISLTGFVFTVQASKEFLKTFFEALSMVLLALLLYIIYKLAYLIIGG